MLITSLIMAVVVGGPLVYLYKQHSSNLQKLEQRENEQLDESSENIYTYQYPDKAIALTMEGENANVLNMTPAVDSIYQTNESKSRKDRLDKIINRKAPDMDEPLFAYNPFGTDSHSLYFYAKSNRDLYVKYTITVADKSVPDFTRIIKEDSEQNTTKLHEFIIRGLVSGMENYIRIQYCTENDELWKEELYKFTLPKTEFSSNRISMTVGKKSKETSSLGLYFVFSDALKEILMTDNSGIVRGEIPSGKKGSNKLITTSKDLLLGLDENRIVRLNKLGQVIGVYMYADHNGQIDFDYDGYGNIVAIVNGMKKSEVVLTDIQSGVTKTAHTFKKGIKPTAIDMPNAKDVVVSLNNGKVGTIENITSARTKLRKQVKGSTINILYGALGKDVKESTARKIMELLTNGIVTKKDGHYIVCDAKTAIFYEYDSKGKIIKQFSLQTPLKRVYKCDMIGLWFFVD